jgi:hypothetical protein
MIGGLWKSTSSLAMFAAAGLFVGGVAMPSAKAADLGGDCCADLEERVAELEATTARKGNRRVSLTISGQVTTSLMYWNDGGSKFGGPLNKGSNASDVFVNDFATSGGSLFSFAGSARINPNLSAGFNITMGLCGGARSHQISQNDDDAPQATCFPGGGADTRGGDTTVVMTLANWYLDHTQLGRLTVGRINTATAGITTIDLGGAGVIANASIGYWQRGMNLIIDDTIQAGTWNNALGGGTVNGASLSRANAIMYNSPTLGGFSAAASWGENDTWDVALRYAGEYGGFRLAAGIGYQHNSTGLNDVNADIPSTLATAPQPNVLKGSASVMHVASGIYLTGAYLNQDNDTAGRVDTRLYYVQGGIAKNWTGLGNTTVYGEWARVDDGIICGAGACVNFGGNANDIITSSQATVWGIGIVQNIDAASMELFLSYRRYSAEVTSPEGNFLVGTETFSDMDVVMGGARIRF